MWVKHTEIRCSSQEGPSVAASALLLALFTNVARLQHFDALRFELVAKDAVYVASGWIGEDRERAILPLYDAGVRQRRYRWSLFGIRDQLSV